MALFLTCRRCAKRPKNTSQPELPRGSSALAYSHPDLGISPYLGSFFTQIPNAFAIFTTERHVTFRDEAGIAASMRPCHLASEIPPQTESAAFDRGVKPLLDLILVENAEQIAGFRAPYELRERIEQGDNRRRRGFRVKATRSSKTQSPAAVLLDRAS
jgi:hypothetical protein